MDNQLLILHLTDIHLKAETNESDIDKIIDLIVHQMLSGKTAEYLLVILSGDITYSGQKAEFQKAEYLITKIVSSVMDFNILEKNIFIISSPGNHDCNFIEDSKSRASLIRDILNGNESLLYEIDTQNIISKPLDIFKRYELIHDKCGQIDFNYYGKSANLRIGNNLIQIRTFNSPLFSFKNEQKGGLFIPLKYFAEGWNEAALKIGIMHHPYSWFSSKIAREVRATLRGKANFIFCGHEHVSEGNQIQTTTSVSSSECHEYDGGHCVIKENSDFEYSIHNINFAEAFIESTYVCGEELIIKKEITNKNSFNKTKSIVSLNTAYKLKTSFVESSNDVGFNISNKAGSKVLMKDLYIKREFESYMQGGKVSNSTVLINHDEVADINCLKNGLLIEGAEKSGKTSFLNTLFEKSIDADWVPLYISLKDKNFSYNKLWNDSLEAALKNCYENLPISEYKIINKNKKIIFIDDCDLILGSGKFRQFLAWIKSWTDYFVLTISNTIEMMEIVDGESNELNNLRSFKFSKFNRANRHDLIRRWIDVVEDINEDEQKIQRFDYLEKSAERILGQNLISQNPFTLIMLLHTSDVVADNNQAGGTLAYYNDLMVKKYLLKFIDNEELAEYLNFSKYITAEMFYLGVDRLSYEQLVDVNIKFSKKYYTASLDKRLNVLSSAGLIIKIGDNHYKCKHNYFYYLFLSQHLVSQDNNPDVKLHLDNMCSHLYMNSNASVVLFYLYFTNSSSLLNIIQDKINNLLVDYKEYEIGVDTKNIKILMDNAKKLFVPKNKPLDTRREIARASAHKELDALKDDTVIVPNQYKNGHSIGKFEQMVSLFKITEIVGQILKEQYANIDRDIREGLVKSLLMANLRCMRFLITNLTTNEVEFKKWIQGRIEFNNENASEAEINIKIEAILSSMYQAFMVAFFQKLGHHISSEKTMELVHKIDDSTTGMLIFKMACELSLQRDIPFSEIDNLLSMAKGDLLFTALIRNLIQIRIHLFHTRQAQLQKLARIFEVDVKFFAAIDYNQNSTLVKKM